MFREPPIYGSLESRVTEVLVVCASSLFRELDQCTASVSIHWAESFLGGEEVTCVRLRCLFIFCCVRALERHWYCSNTTSNSINRKP